jgi:hypothetical protein
MNGFMADAPSLGSATTSSTNLKDENGLSPVVTTTSLPTEKFESQTASDDDIALAPVDGGRAAWMFMVGAVIVDAVIGGFPLNFGVFQDFYMTHPPFQDNRLIPMIGTFATVSKPKPIPKMAIADPVLPTGNIVSRWAIGDPSYHTVSHISTTHGAWRCCSMCIG